MRTVCQLGRIRRNLSSQPIVLFLPIHRIDRNQKREQSSPLDVTQKLKTESLPFVRAFDDSGNVRDDESAVVAQLNHAEVWRESGEWIVADFWSRCRNN